MKYMQTFKFDNIKIIKLFLCYIFLQKKGELIMMKFLAKMASDYKKPKGITIIRKRDIPKILYPLKIKDFFGVGKKSSEKLNDLGIYTIGDFASNESYEVKKVLGSFYNTMKEWINGQGDDFVNPNPFDPKSISSSTTFLNNTNDYEEIREYIEKRAREVSQNARADRDRRARRGQTDCIGPWIARQSSGNPPPSYWAVPPAGRFDSSRCLPWRKALSCRGCSVP